MFFSEVKQNPNTQFSKDRMEQSKKTNEFDRRGLNFYFNGEIVGINVNFFCEDNGYPKNFRKQFDVAFTGKNISLRCDLRTSLEGKIALEKDSIVRFIFLDVINGRIIIQKNGKTEGKHELFSFSTSFFCQIEEHREIDDDIKEICYKYISIKNGLNQVIRPSMNIDLGIKKKLVISWTNSHYDSQNEQFVLSTGKCISNDEIVDMISPNQSRNLDGFSINIGEKKINMEAYIKGKSTWNQQIDLLIGDVICIFQFERT